MNTPREVTQKYIQARKESESRQHKNVALHKLKNLNDNEKLVMGYLAKSLQLVPAAKVQELLHIIHLGN